jgi:hypothetical protein
MVSSSFEQAYAYDHEHFELATAFANSVELEKPHRTVTESGPDSNEPSLSSTFRAIEDTKAVVIDPKDQDLADRGPAFRQIGKRTRRPPTRQSRCLHVEAL